MLIIEEKLFFIVFQTKSIIYLKLNIKFNDEKSFKKNIK